MKVDPSTLNVSELSKTGIVGTTYNDPLSLQSGNKVRNFSVWEPSILSVEKRARTPLRLTGDAAPCKCQDGTTIETIDHKERIRRAVVRNRQIVEPTKPFWKREGDLMTETQKQINSGRKWA